MATATVHRPHPRGALTPPLGASKLSLDTSSLESLAVPNKHIPHCPTGPGPGSQANPITPPDTPPSKHPQSYPTALLQPKNPLYQYKGAAPVYPVNVTTLAKALSQLAAQVLPDPQLVFPWLHGLHAENQMQLAFFAARRKAIRNTPQCLRSITIVKVGDKLAASKLKGTVSAQDLLSSDKIQDSRFIDADPREGFNVRNFQIQQNKGATLSDIVVYGDSETRNEEVLTLASRFAAAQRNCREHRQRNEEGPLEFNTYVLTSPYHEIEKRHPELIEIGSRGQLTGHAIDLIRWEHEEMSNMSKTSEIARNVWVGPTVDLAAECTASWAKQQATYDIYIETNDYAQMPSARTLSLIRSSRSSTPQHLDFPASGSVVLTKGIDFGKHFVEICQWIHQLADPAKETSAGTKGQGSDVEMTSVRLRPRRVFLHCADGYTESTLLATAYLMYTNGIPLHEAWLRLHCEQERNFFAYPSDLVLLSSLQCRILHASPFSRHQGLKTIDGPAWLSQMDGSFPSRILPHLYLGNIGHANNPDMLRAIGIRKLISVGEPVSWTEEQSKHWGSKHILAIDRVQDNGVDSLTGELEKALEFIESGASLSHSTLVHCRVGVSRSATICIAAVMSSLQLSFPRAYCFVRARRLNVIIQPHLRFVYELMKWDEELQRRRGEDVRREMEWAELCGQIAAMNRPYAR